MKTIKLIPSVCKGEGAKWSGHIVMRLPTFDEKFEYMENLGVQVGDDGAVVESESATSRLKQVRRMVECSKKHYQEVSLENKETGEKVDSLDDMLYVDELHKVLVEVAGMLISGFKLGNA